MCVSKGRKSRDDKGAIYYTSLIILHVIHEKWKCLEKRKKGINILKIQNNFKTVCREELRTNLLKCALRLHSEGWL